MVDHEQRQELPEAAELEAMEAAAHVEAGAESTLRNVRGRRIREECDRRAP